MSSSTTMFRRGKPGGRPEAVATTVLVEKNGTGSGGGGSSGLALPPVVVGVAQVQRRFCGTGPFDRHWFNLDCCGIACALVTYLLHGFGVYAVCGVLLPPWMSYDYEMNGATAVGSDAAAAVERVRLLTGTGRLVTTLFGFLAFMACAAHFRAMTTDPGAVPPDARPLPDPTEAPSAEAGADGPAAAAVPPPPPGQDPLTSPSKARRLCRRCRAYKPDRAHHCSICRRCVVKMDHHCPWVNNCVGIGNHKYFLLFCFYTFLTCLLSLVLVLLRFSTCAAMLGGGHHHHYHRGHAVAASQEAAAVAHAGGERAATCLDRPSDLAVVLGLLVEALLFGIFTSCMILDQSEVVRTRLTHIDRLKGLDAGGGLPGPAEVFGVAMARGPAAPGNNTAPSSHRPDQPHRFRPDWLSPFHRACFPENLQDQVMGFCRPLRNLSAVGANGSSGHRDTELASAAGGANGLRQLSDLV